MGDMPGPDIRTAVTANSIWRFDVVERRYVRLPRAEDGGHHPTTPYTCEWEPYSALYRLHDRLLVHRPVPYGAGAERLSGAIEWDDLEAADAGTYCDERSTTTASSSQIAGSA